MALHAPEFLRLAAFWVYLGAWLAFGVFAVIGALPERSSKTTAPAEITASLIAGVLLQGISALPITLSLTDGPLRPRGWEVAGALVLAPFATFLFGWVLVSSRRIGGATGVITDGPYLWTRHPMYLAFLALLLGTGFLTSAGLKLIPAVLLYLAGSEIRIASEEAEMKHKFPGDYAEYQLRTRWRYLPGIR
jgi:protein-S-isoprenylcysteine O-methyltransferase Ste14